MSRLRFGKLDKMRSTEDSRDLHNVSEETLAA